MYQNDAPRTADVVFIVEQQGCLGEYDLEDLPKLIDRSLEERGLTDNRFALVGFGGEGGFKVGHEPLRPGNFCNVAFLGASDVRGTGSRYVRYCFKSKIGLQKVSISLSQS